MVWGDLSISLLIKLVQGQLVTNRLITSLILWVGFACNQKPRPLAELTLLVCVNVHWMRWKLWFMVFEVWKSSILLPAEVSHLCVIRSSDFTLS